MTPKFIDFAVETAQLAGAVIKKNFQLGMKKIWKDDATPVTITDQVINKLVIERVTNTFPDHGILGEEESRRTGNERYLWVCDPVDGTIPFSHSVPTCVFSLALVDNGEPVVAAVYDPFMDRMFTSEKGNGAFLNGNQIHVSDSRDMVGAVIGQGFIRKAPVDVGCIVNTIRDAGGFNMNVNSIVYMGMLVAAGELSGLILFSPYPHDSAATDLLIREAGGVSTSLFGSAQRYDNSVMGQLAGNAIIHQKLLTIVKECKLSAISKS